MTKKCDEDSVGLPTPIDGNKTLHKKEPSFWSALTIFVGVLAGGALYVILYLFLTFLFLKLGINIADYHQSWILLNRLLGGIIYALPVLNLFWPLFIFYRSRKRNISFAMGVLSGSVIVMLIVLKVIIDLRHDFPGL